MVLAKLYWEKNFHWINGNFSCAQNAVESMEFLLEQRKVWLLRQKFYWINRIPIASIEFLLLRQKFHGFKSIFNVKYALLKLPLIQLNFFLCANNSVRLLSSNCDSNTDCFLIIRYDSNSKLQFVIIYIIFKQATKYLGTWNSAIKYNCFRIKNNDNCAKCILFIEF